MNKRSFGVTSANFEVSFKTSMDERNKYPDNTDYYKYFDLMATIIIIEQKIENGDSDVDEDMKSLLDSSKKSYEYLTVKFKNIVAGRKNLSVSDNKNEKG